MCVTLLLRHPSRIYTELGSALCLFSLFGRITKWLALTAGLCVVYYDDIMISAYYHCSISRGLRSSPPTTLSQCMSRRQLVQNLTPCNSYCRVREVYSGNLCLDFGEGPRHPPVGTLLECSRRHVCLVNWEQYRRMFSTIPEPCKPSGHGQVGRKPGSSTSGRT